MVHIVTTVQQRFMFVFLGYLCLVYKCVLCWMIVHPKLLYLLSFVCSSSTRLLFFFTVLSENLYRSSPIPHGFLFRHISYLSNPCGDKGMVFISDFSSYERTLFGLVMHPRIAGVGASKRYGHAINHHP